MTDTVDTLDERIENFLEENSLSPFITIHTLIREAKLRDEPELASEIRDCLGDFDLELSNRTSTLLESLAENEENEG